ncbi:MAG: DinB family protein [Actinomycetota bacterium]
MSDTKADFIHLLGGLNDAVLDKLDGLSEYDLRRPLTRTGTNLLGVVKHLASVQAGYFGDVFGRPWPEPMPWMEPDAEPNADLYATAEESSEWVIDFYRRSWVHAQETFAVTDLDDTGTVPWWPEEHRHPTLARILTHMTSETARHAGHLDIVRELIDGVAGRYSGDEMVADGDTFDWPGYVATVEAAAVAASS